MVDLDRQIGVTQARQGGFSAHILPAAVKYERDSIDFLPRQSESEQWLFDFVGLGSPAEVAGAISSTGTFTASLGNDGSPYLDVARTTVSVDVQWTIEVINSRVGTLINDNEGSFKLSLEVWKPADDFPFWEVGVRSPTNNSYARIRTSFSFGRPEPEWRNTDGDQSDLDYALSGGGWTSTPYVNGWNKIVIDNTKAKVSYTVNGELPPIAFDINKFNIKGADTIRIRRSTAGASPQRIRNVQLSAY